LEAKSIKRGSPEWFEGLMKCKEGTALGISISAIAGLKTRHPEEEAVSRYMENVR
jgi:hypothetical protein